MKVPDVVLCRLNLDSGTDLFGSQRLAWTRVYQRNIVFVSSGYRAKVKKGRKGRSGGRER